MWRSRGKHNRVISPLPLPCRFLEFISGCLATKASNLCLLSHLWGLSILRPIWIYRKLEGQKHREMTETFPVSFRTVRVFDEQLFFTCIFCSVGTQLLSSLSPCFSFSSDRAGERSSGLVIQANTLSLSCTPVPYALCRMSLLSTGLLLKCAGISFLYSVVLWAWMAPLRWIWRA